MYCYMGTSPWRHTGQENTVLGYRKLRYSKRIIKLFWENKQTNKKTNKENARSLRSSTSKAYEDITRYKTIHIILVTFPQPYCKLYICLCVELGKILDINEMWIFEFGFIFTLSYMKFKWSDLCHWIDLLNQLSATKIRDLVNNLS